MVVNAIMKWIKAFSGFQVDTDTLKALDPRNQALFLALSFVSNAIYQAGLIYLLGDIIP